MESSPDIRRSFGQCRAAAARATAPDETPRSGVVGVAKRSRPYFIPRSSVSLSSRRGTAALEGPFLTVPATGERFVLRDAVRFLGPRGRGADVLGMTGRLVAVSEVLAAGGEVGPAWARVAGGTYDVEGGYLAYPVTDSRA
jgi:hypothetical protein